MNTKPHAIRLSLLAFALGLFWMPLPLAAQTVIGTAEIASALSPRVLFVVSGGFWQEEPDETEVIGDGDTTAPVAARGYYRIVAMRSQDNTSRLYLQRIRLGDTGPDILDSLEIEALTDMRAYITDMRPESSSGIADRPGFAAFIYLKLDPASAEPDTYELFVDDFGDVAFLPASN